jgi:hypothetical protein
MHVGMQRQVLSPRVQNGQTPEQRLQLRMAHVHHRVASRLQQRRIEHLRAVQRQLIEDFRHGEHQMKIRHRQQLPLPCREPLLACVRLTRRTVTVSA